MLTIRLQRTGKRHQPQFRVVLAEKQKSASKKFIEILGTYNPRTKDFVLKNQDRVKYWLGQHVELSPTVQNMLVDKGVLDSEKVKAWSAKKKKDQGASQPKAGAKAETPVQAAEPAPTESEAQKQAKESEVQEKSEAASEAPVSEHQTEENKA